MKQLLDLLPQEPGSTPEHRAKDALIRWLLSLPDDADPAAAAQALLDRPAAADEPASFRALLRKVADCRDLVPMMRRGRGRAALGRALRRADAARGVAGP